MIIDVLVCFFTVILPVVLVVLCFAFCRSLANAAIYTENSSVKKKNGKRFFCAYKNDFVSLTEAEDAGDCAQFDRLETILTEHKAVVIRCEECLEAEAKGRK